jgi:hypothetical protein
MALSRFAHVLIFLSFVVIVSGYKTTRGARLNGVSTTTRFGRRRLVMGGKEQEEDVDSEEWIDYEEDQRDDKQEESEVNGDDMTEEYGYENATAIEESEDETMISGGGMTKGGYSTGVAVEGSAIAGGMMTGSSRKHGGEATWGAMKAGGKSSVKGQSSDAKLRSKKSKLDTKMNKILSKGGSSKGLMGGASVKTNGGASLSAAKSSYSGAKARPKDAVKAHKKKKLKTKMNMVAKSGDTSRDETMEYSSPEEAYPIGGEQDDNGCFLSAGYVWCPELDECIQPFADDCPLEGESFVGPIVVDCSDDMRCSVTKDCVIKEAGGNFVQGPYLTELTGNLNIPIGCTATCTGCAEFDPINGFSADEVMGTSAPTIPKGDTPTFTPLPDETTSPTFAATTSSPDEAASAPSFAGEPVSRVPLNFTIRFGFFDDKDPVEPTQGDLAAVLEQVNLFYTDLFANNSESFVAFEAFCKCIAPLNAHNSTATP